MKFKFKILTIGCKVNQYESEAFANQLKILGFENLNGSKTEADICIINGCAVTAQAERKTRLAINAMRNKNPLARIILTGCASKNFLQTLNGIEYYPNSQKKDLIARLFPEYETPYFGIEGFEGHTRAFVKVQDGCNFGCSYCIIPQMRGEPSSKNSTEIIDEVKRLVSNGYKEIVLTGINISLYKADVTFEGLLRKVEMIEGLERIKISSIDPMGVSDELIDIITGSEKFCLSLHLVLQSGSDKILKLMKRKYSRKMYLEKVEKILSKRKDFTFTTDIIVGFPNEDDKDFEKTLDMVRKVKFVKVHIFSFSPRPNTLAYKMENRIAPKIIEKRKAILQMLANEVAMDRKKQFLNCNSKVLFERPKGGIFFGSAHNNLPVCIDADKKDLHNKIKTVKFMKVENNQLWGSLCE